MSLCPLYFSQCYDSKILELLDLTVVHGFH